MQELQLPKRLKVGLLFDIPFPAEDSLDCEKLLTSGPEWADERDILRALRANNHEVIFLPIFDSIERLITQLSNNRPDIVFFSCESVQHDRTGSHCLLGLLDLLKVPHTGAKFQSLQLCSDKALSKKVLTYHNIQVPGFRVWDGQTPISRFDLTGLRFPLIVKPLKGEGSEGIYLSSVTHDKSACLERMSITSRRHPGPIIVEEFVDGRELYIGVMGNSEIRVLEPREFFMRGAKDSKDKPLVASFKAKWDDRYRKSNGIMTKSVKSMPPEISKAIERVAVQVCSALDLQGYSRLDIRLDQENNIHVLEANPNPSISKSEEFAAAAAQSGIAYNDLIQKIVELGLARSA
jgi:D-alanine-D-alanine ligase